MCHRTMIDRILNLFVSTEIHGTYGQWFAIKFFDGTFIDLEMCILVWPLIEFNI